MADLRSEAEERYNRGELQIDMEPSNEQGSGETAKVKLKKKIDKMASRNPLTKMLD